MLRRANSLRVKKRCSALCLPYRTQEQTLLLVRVGHVVPVLGKTAIPSLPHPRTKKVEKKKQAEITHTLIKEETTPNQCTAVSVRHPATMQGGRTDIHR